MKFTKNGKRNRMKIIDSESSRVNSLVLHRIVSHASEYFEDVGFDTLKHLLSMRNVRFLNLDAAMSEREGGNIVCLTFDDGHSSDWDFAFPILHEMGAKATFFVVTDWIGKPGFLSVEQIRELRKNGMQIGSHSCSHPNLLELSHNCFRPYWFDSGQFIKIFWVRKITGF